MVSNRATPILLVAPLRNCPPAQASLAARAVSEVFSMSMTENMVPIRSRGKPRLLNS
jgi:hypothetical protein